MMDALRPAARRIRNLLVSRTIILAYHRVAEARSDPLLLAVTPRHFAEHLEVLRREYRPVPLREALQRRRNSVVITLDDGYADNLLHAKPLLARHDVPATVFVTSGYVGRKRAFWWDELEELTLSAPVLPRAIELKINGAVMRWQIETQDNAAAHGSWNVLEDRDPTPRQGLYRVLHQLLRTAPEWEQQAVLRQLRELSGRPPIQLCRSRPLSAPELVELERDGLVEIGAHTVTHPVLAAARPEAQRLEIERSKADLERILGHRIASFAYPFGARSDYSQETVALVRQAGYERACANFAGFVSRGGDPFQLPRFLIRDWDGDRFSSQLRQWLSG